MFDKNASDNSILLGVRSFLGPISAVLFSFLCGYFDDVSFSEEAKVQQSLRRFAFLGLLSNLAFLIFIAFQVFRH